MKAKWFSNLGQLLQLIVAALALLTALNAWSAVKQLDFFALAPVIFYLSFGALLLVIIVRVGKFSGPPDTAVRHGTTTPAVAPPPPTISSQRSLTPFIGTITILAGDFYDGSHLRREFKITLKDVLTTTVPKTIGEETVDAADLEIGVGGSLVYGGAETKQVSTNRFICPAVRNAHDAELRSVFQFVYTRDYFSFLAIRVDHVNLHAKEAVLTICYTTGRLNE